MINKFIFIALKSNLFKSVFIQKADFFERVYGSDTHQKIASRVKILGSLITPETLDAHKKDLSMADFIFTGWGAPNIDELLPLCPRVKVIFFAGGAASLMLNRDIWDRGILLTSSYVANAVPVAEYTLAAILFGLKGGWRAMMEIKLSQRYVRRIEVPGSYQSTIGLISCGAIARELLRLLRVFNLKVLVYDPFMSNEQIHALGAKPASMEEIFSTADVVSLHAPELEETRGMIRDKHLAAMKSGATFINTARGSIVNEPELYEVARQRPDLQFVLDVVHPEPPLHDSPLFNLTNVIVTPHLAGAMGGECLRMGQYMLEELDRYLAGKPLRWLITPELAANSIHRPVFMKTSGALEPA